MEKRRMKTKQLDQQDKMSSQNARQHRFTKVPDPGQNQQNCSKSKPKSCLSQQWHFLPSHPSRLLHDSHGIKINSLNTDAQPKRLQTTAQNLFTQHRQVLQFLAATCPRATQVKHHHRSTRNGPCPPCSTSQLPLRSHHRQ